MKVFVTIIFILVSVALTAIVLVQEGKDAGLGTIGGIGETYWAKNKSRSMEGNLVKFTKWLAAIFLVLAVLLNMMPDKTKATTPVTTSTEAEVSSTETELSISTEIETEIIGSASTEAEKATEAKTTEAKTTEAETEKQ